ncbi:MAG: hypothetical protein H6541_08225 [Lentimicrobiaceae bacterium]|nr:hypothetical protein [Lentimicrobiaceae bacterium]MCB9023576.1 hypothetical protein [Lentimicrobiaceae bacterium]MCO5264390.1 putative porin [Lentimicrobium sp.]HPG33009.1 hypothetical protein [Lentimicrobium sp.]
MRLNSTLLLLFLLASFGLAHAQGNKEASSFVLSPDSASVYAVTLHQRFPGEKIVRLSDTLLTGNEFYIPTESADLLNAVNGNTGLAYKSLIFNPSAGSGFRFAPSVYGLYLLSNQNIPYYRLRTPYTKIFYTFGKGKEQLFNVTHAQNISRGITLGIDLRIVNSIGIYNRQKSDNASVAVQGQFVSDNERYVVLANYRNSRFKWRENGGITYDSLFTDNIETDRQRIGINLSDADNQVKESGVFIRQFYYLGRNPFAMRTDTIEKDTLRFRAVADTMRHLYNPQRSNFFRHTFTYTRNSLLYTDGDPASGFYTDIFADSVSTYDSLYYHEFVNDFAFEGGIGKARGSDKAIVLRAGIEHAFSVYRNDTISKKYSRLTPYAYLAANAFGYARAEGYVWLSQGAPFNGDKGLSGKLTFPAYDNSTSWGNISAGLEVNALQPDFLYQFHYSNHFRWENSFGQQTIVSGKAMYERHNLKAGFNFYNLGGWVYLNEEAKPARADGNISVSQAWGQAAFKLGSFDLNAFAVWQNASDEDVIHLPELAGRLSVYHTVVLFKRALHLQTGLSVMYNSAFYGDAYMPALRSYYLQRQTETGDYPYMDAFVNVRVKRARMYLIAKHVNSGLMGYNYIQVPGYPMPDRGIHFGVSWQFYD